MDTISIVSVLLGMSSIFIAVYARVQSSRVTELPEPVLVRILKHILSRKKALGEGQGFMTRNWQTLRRYSYSATQVDGYIEQSLLKRNFPRTYIPLVKMNLMGWYNLKVLLHFFSRYYVSKVSANNLLVRAYTLQFDQRLAPLQYLTHSITHSEITTLRSSSRKSE